jgi:hypothetical protein
MRERGDFDCLHEPFLHYYYIERSDKALPHFDSEQDHPSSYAQTRDMILEKAEQSPVFAKDMSYYVIPQLLEDTEFCRRVRHCFLIRNPLRSIMSYYRLDNNVQLNEIGLEAQWRHFQGLEAIGIGDCIVLEAEAVQAHTVDVMRSFCNTLGLDFMEHALNWEAQSTPQDWQYVQGWHQKVSDSEGIHKLPSGDDARASTEFEALCRDAPQLRDFLDYHLPFYQQLRAHSLSRPD